MSTSLSIDLIGDTEILVTRHFNGTPEQVYRAHTDPVLIAQWMLGPDGWTMPVCVNDPKPGGSLRFEWTNGSSSFYLTGEYISATPFRRIEHVERMFMPNRMPDNHVITEFRPDRTGTLMTMRMRVAEAATRDAMMATGMTQGMEASYARLDAHTAKTQDTALPA